jgi:hypothetical protein
MSKKREIKVASDGGRLISPPPLSEEHQRHQALFKERRKWAGFCRWMASRYGTPATADKPRKPPVPLRADS